MQLGRRPLLSIEIWENGQDWPSSWTLRLPSLQSISTCRDIWVAKPPMQQSVADMCSRSGWRITAPRALQAGLHDFLHKHISDTGGALCAALVMLGEWWSSEITTVIAGRLPDPDKSLSAMSIFQQACPQLFCFI